ncbi:MAG: DNA polymerase III subunit delta [Deltaproteobacteria bacterium RIFCSPLOWO2_02_56_12]|nr:MAG: DNA polymerase III subunit delta [Deltaproteobacteria bacterium RIFCSPLOWO2_02_56_12]
MKQELEAVLAEIRKGEEPSLLLLHGDDYQVHAASKALLDLLVPPERRAFNLEQFDGRVAPWDEIEAALMTPPFLPGTKTVLVENAPYFLSREHKGEVGARVLQLWGEGKKDEAAKLFLDLLIVEGWTQERWERFQDSTSGAELAELLGGDGRELKEEVEGLLLFCRNSGMELSQRRGGEGHRLMEFLEQGLPPWDVLLITANVDRRTRLYKRFEEKGSVLDLSIGREKSGRMSREALAEFLDQRLKEGGKKIEAQARGMILARAGAELWAVHQELEKLFLYVGEEPWIKVKDVEEVFSDQGEGWVFDLTKALAARDSVAALSHLLRLLSQGHHPLALLAPIASEVRRLMAARQLIEGELRERWKAGMSYPQFQKSMLHDGAAPLPGNPYFVYMSFKSADNFTLKELVRYLGLLYQTDVRLKSTGHPPRMVMERLILEMCRPLRAMQNEK